MKSLCFILLLALCAPGCSMFSKSSRQDRAYSKYVRKNSLARERQRTRAIRQRAEMPSLRSQPTPGPVEESIKTSEGQ
jgi:hypothetical protein